MESINLFPHQKKALEETKNLNRVAYYLDMGLGKTYVGSEKMIELGYRVNLVVCQKSKVQDWLDHFEMYSKTYHNDNMIFDLTDCKEACEAFIDVVNDKCYGSRVIGVINYELAWRRPELLNLTNFTLMLDESSLIQNRKAKQTKFILKMQPANVILLSGTPTAGKYENLWTQLHLLGWSINESLYNKQYVNWKKINMGGFVHKIVDKKKPYKNVDRLKQKLHENGAVFMKTEECFELPEQTFINRYVNTTREYRKFIKDCIVKIGDTELIGDTTLTKRLYARQLCGQYNQEKLNMFKELAESTQDRLIVFYNFNAELEKLKDIAAELQKPISEVNGSTKDLKNYENEDNSITFIQYQAGAMGLNLQKANKIVYFTLTDKSELFEQSKKRIHRIGQDKPCFYYVLLCKKSVEEVVLKTLQMRKDFTDELFTDYLKG